MQWADEATLDAIHYLRNAGWKELSPVLFLFNWQTGIRPAEAQLVEWVTNLEKHCLSDTPGIRATLSSRHSPNCPPEYRNRTYLDLQYYPFRQPGRTGLVYQALLLPEKAIQAHLEALKLSETASLLRYIGLSLSLLCVDYVLAGELETAATYARQVLANRDPRAVVCPEVPRWPETLALVHVGLSKQATEDLQAFLQVFGANKRCAISYARANAVLAESQGENELAQTCLQEAIAGAKDIGLPGELWQAEAALGRLYLAEEYEQAAQAFARAVVVVEELASPLTSDELRLHFLAAPQVRDIFIGAVLCQRIVKSRFRSVILSKRYDVPYNENSAQTNELYIHA